MNRTSRLERRKSAVTQSDVESGRSADRHRRVAVALFVAYVGGWALPLNAPAEDVITLHSEDGIEVIGKTTVEKRLAAKCLEGPYAQQSLALWRVDYWVVNKSGRRLASVTAEVPIASPMPRCDKWSPLSSGINEPTPVLWGDSVHMLHSSGLDKKKDVRGAVFVLVSHDQQPRFGSPTLTYTFAAPCSDPAPLFCSPSSKLRIDPTLLMISRRYTWDDRPKGNEINPFEQGSNLELRLAGLDLAFQPWEAEIRLGVNMSIAISNYVHSFTDTDDTSLTDETNAPEPVDEMAMMTTEESLMLTVFSASVFAQVNNLFRLEGGWMFALADHEDLRDGEGDKNALYVGITFPLPSDQIRKLVEKLW